jgi:phosphatidylglycerol---prolipoprotein diacylglyceryl transferase
VARNPAVLLMIWNGLSSVGGFFGALVGFFWYLKKMKQPYLVFADMSVFGLMVGFTMGRLGCSLVHDHPGSIVDPSHPLAVGPWPGGEFRFDNGLLEFLYLVPIVLFIHFVYNWRKAAPGRIAGLMCVLYAPFRFTLDFMREKDKTYLGLTTAHYATMILLALGIYLLFIRKPKASDLAYAKDSERIAQEREAADKKKAEQAAAPSST